MNRRARSGFVVRRLAQVLKGDPDDGPPVISATNGTVAAVTAGGSVDGAAQLTVTVNGSDTFAPYLDSYLTPTVGDLVRVQFVNGSPLILGRVVGLPQF